MKNFYLSIGLLFLSLNGIAQIISIPDANFKARLLLASNNNQIAYNSSNNAIKIDSNNNGEIEISEALLVYKLNLISSNFPTSSYISNLIGLSAFQNLRVLNCFQNNLTQIDLLPLAFLEEFDGSYNAFLSLDISNLVNLKKLLAHTNQISTITQNNNMLLENIWLYNNLLTSFDLSVFPAMKVVSIANNNLSTLVLTGATNLIQLDCSGNQLSDLDFSTSNLINYLWVSGNLLSNISISNLTFLFNLNVSSNPITSLNVNGLNVIQTINISNTNFSVFDGSQCGVIQLFCKNNSTITHINTRNNIIGYSDPSLLYFAFMIENNPLLVSICTDGGEQNNLAFTNYNSTGNVVVYNGVNCNIPVQVNMEVADFNKEHITLYPNPTSGIINIAVSNNQPIIKATINNLLGQTIMTFENSTTLDISFLTKGTYFITVETDSGKTTQQIIKL